MRTLVSVGDRKTVKVLKRIIRTESDLRNVNVVRDAAREFLPVLNAKIAENEEIFRRLQTLANDQAENPDAVIAIQAYVDTLPPESVPVVLVEYLMQQKQRAAQSRVFAGVGLFAICGAFALMYFFVDGREYAGLIGALGAALAVGASLCASTVQRPVGEMQAGKVAYELAKRSGDDTRLLPVLLYALHPIVDKKQRETVQKAILHLLPLLSTGDAALVPPRMRPPLRAWLILPRGALTKTVKDRGVVALNALALIGDTRSLHKVLVVERHGGNAKHNDYLRQTAARCADALKSRKPLA